MLLDLSNFDWSVRQFMLDMDAQVRKDNSGVETDIFHKMAILEGFCVYVGDSGYAFAQKIRGIVNSGSYTTGSTNSRIRALLSMLYFGPEHPIATMGDDSVESVLGDADVKPFLDFLRSLGIQPKESALAVVDKFNISFCSHLFILVDGTVRPQLENSHKVLANFLLDSKRSGETLAGIRVALRHSPFLPALESYVQAKFPELHKSSFNGACTPYK